MTRLNYSCLAAGTLVCNNCVYDVSIKVPACMRMHLCLHDCCVLDIGLWVKLQNTNRLMGKITEYKRLENDAHWN